jgi:predicted lactoylglutathione lyase
MKSRRVLILIELESNRSVKDLKQAYRSAGGEAVKQIQVNVIQTKEKKK